MKKAMIGFILMMFLVGFVIASPNESLTNSNASNDGDEQDGSDYKYESGSIYSYNSQTGLEDGDDEDDDESEDEDENGTALADKAKVKVKIKAGEYIGENGELIRIQNKSQDRIQIKVKNISADTELEVEEEKEGNKTKLKVKLSNGRNAEIKIMPDTASERALERLRIKVCNESNGCSIELKETGKGNETLAVYEIKAKKQFRLFGLFGIQSQVQTEVNAENGEIVDVKKPWWSFLASEVNE